MNIPLWCQIKYGWKLRSKIQQFTFLEIHQKKNNLKATKQLEKGLRVWKLKSFSLNPIQGSQYSVIWLSATHVLRPTSRYCRFPEDWIHFTFLTCLPYSFETFTSTKRLISTANWLRTLLRDLALVRTKLSITKLFEWHKSCWACQLSMLTSWDS